MMSPASQLRLLLDNNSPVVAPGALNALFAKLIEEADFKAVYLSGAGVANSLLGVPDLGMVTQTEMANITDHDHPYQPAV
jgi:2-methylisocitrate lyase-like PEP mutase family enzyme